MMTRDALAEASKKMYDHAVETMQEAFPDLTNEQIKQYLAGEVELEDIL